MISTQSTELTDNIRARYTTISISELDFYHKDPNVSSNLKYLVFGSRFTTYQNLGKLNKQGIKFITIQRKSQSLEDKIATIWTSPVKQVVCG